MDYRTLGKSKIKVSNIALGTVQFGMDYGYTKKKTQDQVDEILDYAWKKGINLLDTAPAYGDCEEKIGRFISENRSNFIVATKLEKIKDDDLEDYNSIKKMVYNSVYGSIKKLKIDNIKLLQLHQAEMKILSNEDFIRAIRSLKDDELVDSFGISVYEPFEVEYILDNLLEVVDFIQIPYNVFDRRIEKYHAIIKAYNIGIIGRSAFLKGMIVCDDDKLPIELEGLKPFRNRLWQKAKNANLSVEEVGLSFITGRSFVDTVIVGVDSVKELEENIHSAERKFQFDINDFEDILVPDEGLIDPRKWKSV